MPHGTSCFRQIQLSGPIRVRLSRATKLAAAYKNVIPIQIDGAQGTCIYITRVPIHDIRCHVSLSVLTAFGLPAVEYRGAWHKTTVLHQSLQSWWLMTMRYVHTMYTYSPPPKGLITYNYMHETSNYCIYCILQCIVLPLTLLLCLMFQQANWLISSSPFSSPPPFPYPYPLPHPPLVVLFSQIACTL